MKRCPQCHFTFSDDQQFCDFDHTELTFIPPPSKEISAVPPGRLRRAARSPIGLAILAVGVGASAVLVGYLDTANDRGLVTSNSEVQPASSPLLHAPLEKSHQALIEPLRKPRSISTQRQLGKEDSSAMPSSILKWEPHGSVASSTSVPHRQSTSKRAAANVVRNRRATVTSNKAGRSNKAMYARNHKAIRTRTAERKESKVVAILKKTGSILTKPFRF